MERTLNFESNQQINQDAQWSETVSVKELLAKQSSWMA